MKPSAWMTFMATHNPKKGAQLARRVFDVNIEDDTQAALEGISRLRAFYASLGLPITLAQLGVEDPDFDLLVKKLHENKGDVIGGYYRLTSVETMQIYKLAQ